MFIFVYLHHVTTLLYHNPCKVQLSALAAYHSKYTGDDLGRLLDYEIITLRTSSCSTAITSWTQNSDYHQLLYIPSHI